LQVGSFSLEFRALSSALGDPKHACIADKMQLHIVGNVSSPWPLGENLYQHTPIHTAFGSVDASGGFQGTLSFGSGSDSFYEYLLKSHLMMPHDNPQLYVELYRRLVRQLNFEYDRISDSDDAGVARDNFGDNAQPTAEALTNLLSRFSRRQKTKEQRLLFAHGGRLFLSALPGGRYHEQLACFLPGLMMLGSMMLPDRAMSRDQIIAEKLLDGCLWTYNDPSLSRHGLGADFIDLEDPQNGSEASPNQQSRSEADGQGDGGGVRRERAHRYSGEYNYYLRPETVESVFIAWRSTRDPKWRKAAWDIFTALKKLQVSGGGFHELWT
jgi:hypothetical protein